MSARALQSTRRQRIAVCSARLFRRPKLPESAMSTTSNLSRTVASVLPRRNPQPITATSFRAAFIDGRWHKAAISGMQRAKLLKMAPQLSESERAAIPDKSSTRPSLPVKFKGHKAERIAPMKSARQTTQRTRPSHTPTHTACRVQAPVERWRRTRPANSHLYWLRCLFCVVVLQGGED